MSQISESAIIIVGYGSDSFESLTSVIREQFEVSVTRFACRNLLYLDLTSRSSAVGIATNATGSMVRVSNTGRSKKTSKTLLQTAPTGSCDLLSLQWVPAAFPGVKRPGAARLRSAATYVFMV